MRMGPEPSRIGSWTVVRPTTDLDLATGPELRSRIVELVASGQIHIVIDLVHVEFVDSTGLGVLVGALKRTRVHDGDLRIANAVPRVRRVLQITDLDRVFEMHQSLESATSEPV